LDQHGLKKKIITCLKDERLNLNAMTSALIYVVGCEVLRMDLKVSIGLVLGIFFLKLVNMPQNMKKFAKDSNMCQ
jgi:hypothetical protein